jgi:hypothetical protein
MLQRKRGKRAGCAITSKARGNFGAIRTGRAAPKTAVDHAAFWLNTARMIGRCGGSNMTRLAQRA